MGEGTVHAFEPHPVIFSFLDRNKKKIVNEAPSVEIEVSQIALSEKSGSATLYVPTRWEQNAGLASLEDSAGSDEIEVPTRRLDEVVNSPIHLLKLDVEGHEKAVLNGATGHLEGGGCSYIIFEDHEGRTSAVAKKLKSQGYKIFGIEERLSGPVLRENGPEGAYNLIATANLDQCISEFGPDGWKSLQAQ
jgi:FkbM family methyltransferase